MIAPLFFLLPALVSADETDYYSSFDPAFYSEDYEMTSSKVGGSQDDRHLGLSPEGIVHLCQFMGLILIFLIAITFLIKLINHLEAKKGQQLITDDDFSSELENGI